MRGAGAVLVLSALLLPDAGAGQTIRRQVPRAFRFSMTPHLGLGWGGPRALDNDPFVCAEHKCVTHRLGSSPVGGVEMHVPLSGPLAIGLNAALSRPNRSFCLVRDCDARGRVTALYGSMLLLWRFHRRAPAYLGFGPALAYISPGPVYSQRSAATEIGGLIVAAYDAPLTDALGFRVAWWNYLLGPTSHELTPDATPKNVVWESKLTFGLSLSAGSRTTGQPPRTFTN